MIRVLIMIVCVLALVGCSTLGGSAEAGLELSQDEVVVSSGELSTPIIAAITKKDTNPEPVSYTIRFVNPNAQMVSFTTPSGQDITSIQTALFKRKGDRLSEEFGIRANKPEGSFSTTWISEIEIVYNDSVVDVKPLKIVVE